MARTVPLGPFTHLNDADRQRSLRHTLQQGPQQETVWVFAYGSLMWNPCFAVAERQPAILHLRSEYFGQYAG